MGRRETMLHHFIEQRDETDARVAEGIERNRKGQARVRVLDEKGRPVKGARVTAKQTGHDFQFGGSLNDLDQLGSEEKNRLFRERFREVFNLGTIPIYWSALEPEEGKLRFAKDSPYIYRRPPLDLCLEFCEENGMTPKTHHLNYFQRAHYPAWCPETDLEKAKALCEKRFRELAERYAARIPQWEVINETLGSYIIKDNPAIFYMPDSIEWSFALAEKYFPRNQLIINDDPPSTFGDQRGDRCTYYLQIERALGRGARIDGIGLQSHLLYERDDPALHDIQTDPSKLFATLDLYGKFGLPILITEVTLAIFSDLPEDEDIQAELLKELYSLYFSHPAVQSVIFWDLADGYTPGAGAGKMDEGWNIFRGSLLRYDMSEKPAYRMLRHLVKDVWHTEASFVTDENGEGEWRGFYGDYALEIGAGERSAVKTVSFPRNARGGIVISL